MSDALEDAEHAEQTDSVENQRDIEQEAAPDKAGERRAGNRGGGGSTVKFMDFEIDSTSHLEDYDHGEIHAYAATGKKGQGKYIAYVSEPHLVPRHHRIEVYQAIINPYTARLMKTGAVYWPPAKQERFVFIYEDTLGRKLLQPGDEPALGYKNEVVLERILKPFASILQDFRDRDFVHGSIRPSNIYNGGSASLKKIVLGECLTQPSGVCQGALYEPIERATADPIGRGPGTRPSDMYAFGVTLAVLLRQNDPLADMSDEEIIKRKIDMGSYAAVTGKDRFTGPILELLRGLLHDDAAQRWTIDEMLAWMDGRRLSPKQAIRKIVAPRPIVFNNRKYLQPTILAMDLEKNPGDAKRILEDGELKNWVNRAIEKPELYEKIETSVDALRNAGQVSGYEEKLVSFLSMAIDNDAPIRYRGLHMCPDGIGSVLAEYMAQKRDVNIFVDIFSSNIVMQWVKMQTNPLLDIGSLVQKFDSCRMFVRQKNLGFGLERCLYFLNAEARCMSDKIKGYYVLTPEDLLGAYEEMCKEGKSASGLLIDRHIAAFISVKDGKSIDIYLPDLNAAEHYRKVMANLMVLANIQKRSQLPYFPAIGQAIASQLGAVYKRYHDRTIRDKLKQSVDKFAKEGDLIKMASLIENPDVQAKDFQAFKLAMKEYDDLRGESMRLEARLLDRATFGLATGQEASALVSSMVAGVIILVVAFLYFSDNALF